MGNLKKTITDVSNTELTRKQFLGLVGASLLGMMGTFHAVQTLSTPNDDLATSHDQVFGEREYGYTDDTGALVADDAPRFDQDVFG